VPNFSSLNTSISGLNSHKRVLDVIAHNIANSGTEGYHRQRADLQSLGRTGASGVFAGRSQSFGVDVAGVSRAYDELLATRAVREDASRAAANMLSTSMSTVEGVFPEPTDLGLAHQLDVFWGSWTDLANDPGSLAARTQLLENADTLTTNLRRSSNDLQAVADGAVARMSTLAAEVNDLADQISNLNRTLATSFGENLDLLDQRDVLVGQMANLTGAVARPAANNTVDVYVNGRALVSGTIVQRVDGTTGPLVWESDGAPVNPASGEAQALTAVITDVVPRYRAKLDDIANTLVTQVNALHTTGYDRSSTTGRNFFDPANLTAASISLSVDVAGQPANIAAGAPVLPGPVAPGVLDGEMARQIAALADAATGADTKYQSLITTLAVETRSVKGRASIQDQVADNAIRDADSVGSVSIDEEMANLTAAQRAFEANARVITAVDEMLGFLIERTGVVGR
jgi:flagellar hook-associated protein 1 FlgK